MHCLLECACHKNVYTLHTFCYFLSLQRNILIIHNMNCKSEFLFKQVATATINDQHHILLSLPFYFGGIMQSGPI